MDQEGAFYHKHILDWEKIYSMQLCFLWKHFNPIATIVDKTTYRTRSDQNSLLQQKETPYCIRRVTKKSILQSEWPKHQNGKKTHYCDQSGQTPCFNQFGQTCILQPEWPKLPLSLRVAKTPYCNQSGQTLYCNQSGQSSLLQPEWLNPLLQPEWTKLPLATRVVKPSIAT